jgi:hypothetical protein
MHNENFCNFYASPNIIRVMKSRRTRWAGHVTRVGEMRNPYKILVAKHEGKRPRGRPRYKWEGNNRVDLGEIEWEVVEWIHLTQDWNQ